MKVISKEAKDYTRKRYSSSFYYESIEAEVKAF